MGAIASQITSLANVYSTVYSGADQTKHQSSASLAYLGEIIRWLGNSPHIGPATRKIFLFVEKLGTPHKWLTASYASYMIVKPTKYETRKCLNFRMIEEPNTHMWRFRCFTGSDGKMSYRLVGRRMDASICREIGWSNARIALKLAAISAALLPRRLSNFRATGKV